MSMKISNLQYINQSVTLFVRHNINRPNTVTTKQSSEQGTESALTAIQAKIYISESVGH